MSSPQPRMLSSRDAPPPPWGPAFLRLDSRWYRLEYAAATIAVLVILVVWRIVILRALSPTDAALLVFWAAWPDLAAFLPIVLASRASGHWPTWGPGLYNGVHSLLAWALVLVVWSALAGGVEWPLLAWAGHITADRAAGYYLRAPTSPRTEGVGPPQP